MRPEVDLPGTCHAVPAVASSATETPPRLAQRALRPARRKDCPAREAILRLAQERPGTTLSELRRELGVGWGTAYHHLSRLEKAGLVEIVAAGRRRLLYPSGAEALREGHQRAFLRGATTRRVARFVADHPGCSVKDVVHALGDSPRAVYYHVKRLVALGLVASGSPTRHFDLRPTNALRQILPDAPAPDPRLAAGPPT